MTQPNTNQQTNPQKPKPVFNQATHPLQPQQMTDTHVKEILLETLIELDLIPTAQKRKGISIE